MTDPKATAMVLEEDEVASLRAMIAHADKNGLPHWDTDLSARRVVATIDALKSDLAASRQETEQARAGITLMLSALQPFAKMARFFKASAEHDVVWATVLDSEGMVSAMELRDAESLVNHASAASKALLDRLRMLEGNQRTAGATEVCGESLGRNWDGHIHNNCRGALGLGGGKGCDYEKCPIRRAAMAGEKG